MAINVLVWVNCLGQHAEEVCVEALVHVARHLVEHQPVPDTAVLDVVKDVTIILIFPEIPPDLPLNQQISEKQKNSFRKFLKNKV